LLTNELRPSRRLTRITKLFPQSVCFRFWCQPKMVCFGSLAPDSEEVPKAAPAATTPALAVIAESARLRSAAFSAALSKAAACLASAPSIVDI